jgi:hypothetical protein
MATTNHGKHQMQQIAELHLYTLQAAGRHLPTSPEHPHGHVIGLSPEITLFGGYWIDPAHHHTKTTPGDMLQLGAFYFPLHINIMQNW